MIHNVQHALTIISQYITSLHGFYYTLYIGKSRVFKFWPQYQEKSIRFPRFLDGKENLMKLLINNNLLVVIIAGHIQGNALDPI